jgi:hypothetical protein
MLIVPDVSFLYVKHKMFHHSHKSNNTHQLLFLYSEWRKLGWKLRIPFLLEVAHGHSTEERNYYLRSSDNLSTVKGKELLKCIFYSGTPVT